MKSLIKIGDEITWILHPQITSIVKSIEKSRINGKTLYCCTNHCKFELHEIVGISRDKDLLKSIIT